MGHAQMEAEQGDRNKTDRRMVATVSLAFAVLDPATCGLSHIRYLFAYGWLQFIEHLLCVKTYMLNIFYLFSNKKMKHTIDFLLCGRLFIFNVELKEPSKG